MSATEVHFYPHLHGYWNTQESEERQGISQVEVGGELSIGLSGVKAIRAGNSRPHGVFRLLRNLYQVRLNASQGWRKE